MKGLCIVILQSWGAGGKRVEKEDKDKESKADEGEIENEAPVISIFFRCWLSTRFLRIVSHDWLK